MCTSLTMWRSENSFGELILSFHCGFQGQNTGYQACPSSPFPAEPSLWPHSFELLSNVPFCGSSHYLCFVDGLWSSFFFYFMQNIQLWTFCLGVLVWMQVSVFLLVMYLRIELLGCMMTLLSPFRDSFLKWLPTSMPVMCLLHILANLCFALLIIVLWMGVRGHLIVVWLSSYGVGWCCMSSCTHWTLLYLFWVLSFLILCPFENWLFIIFIIDV